GIRDFHVTGVQTCALPIFDEIGGLVLVHVHRADELGRDAGPIERASAVRRERVAAVELRTDESKTANQVAAPFGRREVGRGPAESGRAAWRARRGRRSGER